jgi:hypothetical protein
MYCMIETHIKSFFKQNIPPYLNDAAKRLKAVELFLTVEAGALDHIWQQHQGLDSAHIEQQREGLDAFFIYDGQHVVPAFGIRAGSELYAGSNNIYM